MWDQSSIFCAVMTLILLIVSIRDNRRVCIVLQVQITLGFRSA